MNIRTMKAGAAALAVCGLGYAGYHGVGMASALANAADLAKSPVFAEADPSSLAQVAGDLQLTQDQRHKIRGILETERTSAMPDIQSLMKTAAQVRSMTDSGDATVGDIRPVITGQQPAIENAIVDIARTKSEIYHVLTPEQRSRADAMLADRDNQVAARIAKLSGSSDKLVSAMAWRLDLTDSQQSQIRSIVDTSKFRILNLARTLEGDRVKLQQATAGGAYDEATVRGLAVDPSQNAVELATELANVKSQIFAVLTPDQRAKLEAARGERRRHFLALWRGQSAGA
jgi:Spy/CpxP family protein refolding chaperone